MVAIMKRNFMPTFEKFWKWLQKNDSLIENLGGEGQFEINASGNNGVCTPQSSMKRNPFTEDQAKKVWKRFRELSLNERLTAGRYVKGPRPHNWADCPNRNCSPWIAAAIRNFLISRI
jgi:hypothetical protein